MGFNTKTSQLRADIVFNTLVNSTAYYLSKMGLSATVLGISGGIDSTICAIICHEVSKRTGIPLLGFSLPCSTNKGCENSTAKLVGEQLCDEFHVVSLEKLYTAADEVFNSVGLESTPISRGNIKARLRGNFLYNVAGIRKGLVIDTDNMTEHLLGFWTIAGGDECDFNPIGQLWKTEIYALAEWLLSTPAYKDCQGLKESVLLTPTDGNGVSNSDLDQIAPGYTYDLVDKVLQGYVNGQDVSQLPCADMIINRVKKSEFKRKQRPLIIDLATGDICEKNGNIFIKND